MTIHIENQEKYSAGKPTDLFSVVVQLKGSKGLLGLSDKCHQRSRAIQANAAIVDKTVAEREACDCLIRDFHLYAQACLVPAARMAHSLLVEAFKVGGHDLHTPAFWEDYTLVLPATKSVVEKLATAVQSLSGDCVVYITAEMEHQRNLFKNDHLNIEYCPIVPLNNIVEYAARPLPHLLEPRLQNDAKEIFDAEMLIDRAILSSRRSCAYTYKPTH